MSRFNPGTVVSTTKPAAFRKQSVGLFSAVLALLLCATAAMAQPVARNLGYGAAWGQSGKSAALADFEGWAARYAAATDESAKARLLPEGVRLARARKAALAGLAESNPGQVIDSSVPASVQKRLPAEIAGELETQVSGIGDLSVIIADRFPGGPEVDLYQRFVRLNGQTYRAFVYGRRAYETSKRGIPVHGVMVNGVLALHESAVRELEAGETPDAAKPEVDLRSAAEKASGVPGVFGEMGGKTYCVSSREKLQQAEARLEAVEAGLNPDPAQSAGDVITAGTDQNGGTPTQGSPNTQGIKRVLVIRVDFSDLTGNPHGRGGSPTVYTAAYCQMLIDSQVSPYYVKSSYGFTGLTNTVATQLYRMPHTAASYASAGNNSGLHADAESAASADYNLSSYDRIIVLFSPMENFPNSQITYGGLAQISGPDVWVNGEWDFRVVAHELGHTYGLYHGNLWQVSDGNIISTSGVDTEYGDDYDTMGANFANNQGTDFNPWFKTMLNWITNSQVINVTSNGTYRINRFDNSTGTGTLALKVKKDNTLNYWVGIRRGYTGNASLLAGTYVIWGYNFNRQSDLLDMNTPGNSDADAALNIGQIFTDPVSHITIQAITNGGTAPNEYTDVQIGFPPGISTQPSNVTVLETGTATFSVVATGAPLMYQWRFNTNDIAGETNSSLTLTNVQLTNAGNYSVVVSNLVGSLTSSNALLVVIPYVTVTNVSVIPRPNSAIITWDTTTNATGQVLYGVDANYGLALPLDNTLQSHHAALISGLTPATTYFFELVSSNGVHVGTYTSSFSTDVSLIVQAGQALFSGVWTVASAAPDKFSTFYKFASTTAGSASALATFRPTIVTPALYDVYVWYSQGSNRSHQAPVLVSYSGGSVSATLDETTNGGSWQLVAPRINLAAGSNAFVRLSNDAVESGKVVIADAVRFAYSAGQDLPVNGIPPAWWTSFYFGTNSVNLNGDPDGDGYSTEAEYIAATAPNDPASYLRVRGEPIGTGGLQVVFAPYAGGRQYQLQGRSGLTGGAWTNLPVLPVTINGNGEGVIMVTNLAAVPNFLRLSVLLTQ